MQQTKVTWTEAGTFSPTQAMAALSLVHQWHEEAEARAEQEADDKAKGRRKIV